ncbi:MAG TPA: amidohydrolase family protein [Terracidiphilus sp.]|jgi:N-acetylglucosamine-6-phosphate deacetylase|nr:amidohydrolase family protein [Terracidiphilus sp.]
METTLRGKDPGTGKTIEVRCREGRVIAIEEADSQETGWLIPGLIDLQVNGYRGDDFNSDTLDIDAIQRLARNLLAEGVTTFLPTLVTASEEKILHNLRVIGAARQHDPLLRHMIPYVHIEGPHIAAEDGPRGAHSVEHIRPPDLNEFKRWQAASGNLVGMVTLSPHYAQAPEYICEVAALGVHISLGHTGANAGQILRAVDAGARLSTHLGNGVAGMLPRHPNLIWAQLAEDRLTASFIADGHHLPVDTLISMLRAKTVARAVLISDLVALAGLSPGDYESPVGGRVCLHPDGRLNLAGTDYLAGATATMKDALTHVVVNAGFSLSEAVGMATGNPGRFVGNRGVLRVGARADLVTICWDESSSKLTTSDVFVLGQDLLKLSH